MWIAVFWWVIGHMQIQHSTCHSVRTPSRTMTTAVPSPSALLWHILLLSAPQAMCFDIGYPVSCAGRRSFSKCCRASWWLPCIAVLLICVHEGLYPSTCAAPCATGSRMLWCSVMWFALSFKYILLKISPELSCCHVTAVSQAKDSVLCELEFLIGTEKVRECFPHRGPMAVLSSQMWQQWRRRQVKWRWNLAVWSK